MSDRLRISGVVLSVILIGMVLGPRLHAQAPAPGGVPAAIGQSLVPSADHGASAVPKHHTGAGHDMARSAAANHILTVLAASPRTLDREVSEASDVEKHAVCRRAEGPVAARSPDDEAGRRPVIDWRGPNVVTKQVLRN